MIKWYWFNVSGLILIASSNIAGIILKMVWLNLSDDTTRILIATMLTGILLTFVGFIVATKKVGIKNETK